MAVPISEELWPTHIKYSFDKGNCWHSVPINTTNLKEIKNDNNHTEKIRFTGIVTAPDGSEMVAAIYGYSIFSAQWIVGVVDFEKIQEFHRNCWSRIVSCNQCPFLSFLLVPQGTGSDFEEWHLDKNQCHLGMRGMYKIVKRDSM